MVNIPKTNPTEIQYSEIRDFVSLLLREAYGSEGYRFAVFAFEALTQIINTAEKNGYTGESALKAHFIDKPSDKPASLALVDDLFEHVEINDAIAAFSHSVQIFDPIKE